LIIFKKVSDKKKFLSFNKCFSLFTSNKRASLFIVKKREVKSYPFCSFSNYAGEIFSKLYSANPPSAYLIGFNSTKTRYTIDGGKFSTQEEYYL
jgi:hypothetical protein